tara:strand:- start:26 stop:520 length:495 start_codon:yes stop_codon:yes gene_type:complete
MSSEQIRREKFRDNKEEYTNPELLFKIHHFLKNLPLFRRLIRDDESFHLKCNEFLNETRIRLSEKESLSRQPRGSAKLTRVRYTDDDFDLSSAVNLLLFECNMPLDKRNVLNLRRDENGLQTIDNAGETKEADFFARKAKIMAQRAQEDAELKRESMELKKRRS